MRTNLAAAAFVAALSMGARPALAQNLDQTFDQMDRSAQSFKSLTADIRRTIHTAVINDNSNDSGSMKLKRTRRDTKMLIEFTGKEAKTVALEGETFRIYYPKTNTIQVWDLGKSRALVDQFLLLGFGANSDELKKAYAITWAGEESINGQKTGHLVLVPNSADVLKKLKKAELWIWEAKGIPLQQKFTTSADGDFTTVTYANLKTNLSLTDNELQLKEPKGVHIEHPQRN